MGRYAALVWQVIKRLAIKFEQNRCSALAAQLGFWFLFSLFPFLIFLVALSSFLPFAADPAAVLRALRGVLPSTIYELITPTVRDVLIQPNGWIAAGTLLLALWSASAAVRALIETLNHVYEVADNRPFWKSRLIAVLLTGTLVIVYILAFTLLVLGPVLQSLLTTYIGFKEPIRFIFRLLRMGIVPLAMLTALTLIYTFGPNRRSHWKSVVPGALVALAGWFTVSWAFSFYVQNIANYNRFYGALGAVIALMIWLYLIGLMILIGGLINSEVMLAVLRRNVSDGSGNW